MREPMNSKPVKDFSSIELAPPEDGQSMASRSTNNAHLLALDNRRERLALYDFSELRASGAHPSRLAWISRN